MVSWFELLLLTDTGVKKTTENSGCKVSKLGPKSQNGVSRQLSEIFCQRGQLSEGTTVRGDNCQRGQLSEDQLSEETVRTFLALGQL